MMSVLDVAALLETDLKWIPIGVRQYRGFVQVLRVVEIAVPLCDSPNAMDSKALSFGALAVVVRNGLFTAFFFSAVIKQHLHCTRPLLQLAESIFPLPRCPSSTIPIPESREQRIGRLTGPSSGGQGPVGR